jgi:hypothetical protein
MKWIKGLLKLVVFAAVLVGVLAAGGWWMSHREPEWFKHHQLSQEQAAAAAASAQRQVQRTLNWAADQQAYTDSRRVGAPTTHPSQSLEISFTEDELNGFFQTWNAHFGWSRRFDQYLSDPQIVLRNHQLILAAMVKQMGSVISIEFGPKLDDGKLLMPVDGVLAGRLPLPESFWDRYRNQLVDSIQDHLPDWQQGAQIRPNGTANSDAVAAGMGELLVNLLTNRPANPILFLPSDVRSKQKSIPVKVTNLKIHHQTLDLTVEPLNAEDRATLLDSIRKPEGVRTAAKDSANLAGQQ